MPGLAPFLQLCYDDHNPDVLERERKIILESHLPEDGKNQLMLAAALLGGLAFSAEEIDEVFKAEGKMLRDMGLVKVGAPHFTHTRLVIALSPSPDTKMGSHSGSPSQIVYSVVRPDCIFS